MICIVCHRPFKFHRRKKICSPACKRERWREYNRVRYVRVYAHTLTCVICGTLFLGRKNALVCSKRCRQLRHQQKVAQSRREFPEQWSKWNKRAKTKLMERNPEKERARRRRMRVKHRVQIFVRRRKAKIARTLAQTIIALNRHEQIIGTPRKPPKPLDPIRQMWRDLRQHCPETHRLLRSAIVSDRQRRRYYANVEKTRAHERMKKEKWRRETGRDSTFYRKRAQSATRLSNQEPAITHALKNADAFDDRLWREKVGDYGDVRIQKKFESGCTIGTSRIKS